MMSRKWATFERCYPKVGFQQFFMCVGRRKISSFPCNVAVNEESKMYLKIFKFVKGESGWKGYLRVDAKETRILRDK